MIIPAGTVIEISESTAALGVALADEWGAPCEIAEEAEDAAVAVDRCLSWSGLDPGQGGGRIWWIAQPPA